MWLKKLCDSATCAAAGKALLLFAFALHCAAATTAQPLPTSRRLLASPEPVRIRWANALSGDFSFIKKWNYPQGVERKPNGKPGCADGGFCPPRAEAMQDERGNVPTDSLALFYSLIDTTHQHHSIQCTAWCYEYAGIHILKARRSKDGSVACATEMNEATHCSLGLILRGDICLALIDLNSVAGNGDRTLFYADGGAIQIDRQAWNKGILKAAFSFTFQNREHPDQPMYWRGKIYAAIITDEK